MKSIRTWVYGLMYMEDKILVIKKWRWPFIWLYDLPGWKIEHREKNIESLKREISEETWLFEVDFEIKKLFTIQETFVEHIWEWEQKDQHLIFIIYLVEILKKDINLDFLDIDWDAKWLKFIDIYDTTTPKTDALEKALLLFKNDLWKQNLK